MDFCALLELRFPKSDRKVWQNFEINTFKEENQWKFFEYFGFHALHHHNWQLLIADSIKWRMNTEHRTFQQRQWQNSDWQTRSTFNKSLILTIVIVHYNSLLTTNAITAPTPMASTHSHYYFIVWHIKRVICVDRLPHYFQPFAASISNIYMYNVHCTYTSVPADDEK